MNSRGIHEKTEVHREGGVHGGEQHFVEERNVHPVDGAFGGTTYVEDHRIENRCGDSKCRDAHAKGAMHDAKEKVKDAAHDVKEAIKDKFGSH
ncbi:unnamed protein product [Caenorhabditis auriculariae]|uniref:Uncharacterized protein n=1 Tax=Caenorhabditis auriculariae TaxID=2777116 RepID=A0A8S1HTC3_9PELO|nr:unnamed protein product [Caenorhabditis auriculariae]